MAIHGALVEVAGVGTLLVGSSGIGKSECALELVSRGHRLVADDVVTVRRDEEGRLLGTSPERVRHHMEIRGLGIIHIPSLFGPQAVLDEVAIDLVCRLEPWREGAEYERTGLDDATHEIDGQRLRSFTLPARPAGSLATIVEVAAREHRQRRSGVVAARRLDERLLNEMQRP